MREASFCAGESKVLNSVVDDFNPTFSSIHTLFYTCSIFLFSVVRPDITTHLTRAPFAFQSPRLESPHSR